MVDLTPMPALQVNFSLLFKLWSLDPRAFLGKRRDRQGCLNFRLHTKARRVKWLPPSPGDVFNWTIVQIVIAASEKFYIGQQNKRDTP